MTPSAVNEAILTEDLTSFKRVKGVGPKTAKRLIVELKDKIERMPGQEGIVIPADSSNTTRQEALSALIALGFQRAQIQKAMNKAAGTLDEEADTEAWIKASLQVLTGQR
jgi:Holliday junction DNA helicase RuvA